MRSVYLPFDKCLWRLEHSFLQVSRGFNICEINFQHPSLRDMLLIILQDEPQVRRQYILQASPRGLSSLIEGIPFYEGIHEQEAHTLVLCDESEISLLCERIITVITETIPASMLMRILNSAFALLPEKRSKSVSPGDINLMEFIKTPEGKVLKSILDAVAKQETYDNNTTYSLRSWTKILEIFYELAPYIVKITHPKYISLLARHIKGARIADSIYFMEILFKNEPLIFKQIFNTKQNNRWLNLIASNLHNCWEEGQEFLEPIYDDIDSAHYRYNVWISKAEDLIDLANTFYSFAGIKESEELSELDELIDNALSPPDQEEEEEDGRRTGDEEEEDEEEEDEEEEEEIFLDTEGDETYWDIETLFEDL